MKYLTTSLILLTGLALTVFNTNAYLQLFRESPATVPPQILEIQEKCLFLESLTPDSLQILAALDIELISEAFKANIFAKQKKPVIKVGAVAPKKYTRTVSQKIPKLSGIIWSTEPGGNPKGIALIENKTVEQGGTINGFIVETIQDNGVTLSKGGEMVFLELPSVAFSTWNSGK